MYLEEIGLSHNENHKENTTISSSLLNTSQEPDRLFMNNEQDLILEDDYWQVKDFVVIEVGLTSV